MEALPYFERARDLFPEYPGDDSPSWFLASIYKEQGHKAQAIDELKRVSS